LLNLAKGGDPAQNKLIIFDVLQNIELFKKLFAMKEYADVKMKSYFGVDFSQLKNEIVDEMNKNNGKIFSMSQRNSFYLSFKSNENNI